MKTPFTLFSGIAVVAMVSLSLGVAHAAQKKEESKTLPSPSASTSKSPATAALSAKDKAFMKEAAKGGQMEVDMGHMAEKQGKNADVKKFGSRIMS